MDCSVVWQLDEKEWAARAVSLPPPPTPTRPLPPLQPQPAAQSAVSSTATAAPLLDPASYPLGAVSFGPGLPLATVISRPPAVPLSSALLASHSLLLTGVSHYAAQLRQSAGGGGEGGGVDESARRADALQWVAHLAGPMGVLDADSSQLAFVYRHATGRLRLLFSSRAERDEAQRRIDRILDRQTDDAAR